MGNEFYIANAFRNISIPNDEHLLYLLGHRLGHSLVRKRLRLERKRESWLSGETTSFRPVRQGIRAAFRLSYLLQRASRNALAIQIRHHSFTVPGLPAEFDGYRVLHLSDLHIDMNDSFPQALSDRIRHLKYDLCVLTGDFRFATSGPIERTVAGMRHLKTYLPGPVYAVLGNHDSLGMVPEFEALGIRMLVNESVILQQGKARIHIAGIDDPHHYCTHNFDAARRYMHETPVSILLAHSPEIYKQAAAHGFKLMFCGHTHGGQICLPGGIPIIKDANCPRRYCRGYWRHQQLQGYTSAGAGSSVVELRLNCPPEVTLHTLQRG